MDEHGNVPLFELRCKARRIVRAGAKRGNPVTGWYSVGDGEWQRFYRGIDPPFFRVDIDGDSVELTAYSSIPTDKESFSLLELKAAGYARRANSIPRLNLSDKEIAAALGC